MPVQLRPSVKSEEMKTTVESRKCKSTKVKGKTRSNTRSEKTRGTKSLRAQPSQSVRNLVKPHSTQRLSQTERNDHFVDSYRFASEHVHNDVGYHKTGSDEDATAQLEEIQHSVERLRKQRSIVERIKQDANLKDQQISELEILVQRLRSQNTQLSLKALEREKVLRSELLQAKQSSSEDREAEEALTFELRKLLRVAQQTENNLRCDVARAHAELEELRNASEAKQEATQNQMDQVRQQCLELEDQLAKTRQALYDKTERSSSLEKRVVMLRESYEKQMNDLTSQLNEKKEALVVCKEKVDALALVNTKQRELLSNRDDVLQECERREGLLKCTIKELEENIQVLREQVEYSGQGGGPQRHLERKTAELDKARSTIQALESEIVKTRSMARSSVEASCRQESATHEFQESLQRAAVHRQKMEVQLESLTSKVKELQNQLLREMTRNASLTRRLEDERKLRKSESQKRIEILAQFCTEEDKLEQVLHSQSLAPRYTRENLLYSYGEIKDELGQGKGNGQHRGNLERLDLVSQDDDDSLSCSTSTCSASLSCSQTSIVYSSSEASEARGFRSDSRHPHLHRRKVGMEYTHEDEYSDAEASHNRKAGEPFARKGACSRKLVQEPYKVASKTTAASRARAREAKEFTATGAGNLEVPTGSRHKGRRSRPGSTQKNKK